MADFNVYGIDDLVAKLNQLADTETIAPKMLNAGMEILQPEVYNRAAQHWVSGAMAESIKPGKVERDGNGYYICTRPTGTDRKGVRNMAKACYLEYGVKGRPAVPIITAAVLSAEAQVIAAMRATLEKEVESL